ncbi:glycosyltransferase [Pseudomonadota bacterium]
MRAETLRGIIPGAHWEAIDTDEGFRQAGRIWKSAAFRFQLGPLVRDINQRVVEQTRGKHHDLIWVDKGNYLWPASVRHLRESANCLVHFTPDTAFHANRSRHFYASAFQYDLLVTTKSFEVDQYDAVTSGDPVYLATQAYDAKLHRQPEQLPARIQAAVFIGLCEPDREKCIKALLSAGVPVRLGGRGWEQFVQRHSAHGCLHYLGPEVFGPRYVEEYVSGYVGLGLLSKRFPELHTTRTFEIPACGALLATEKNAETARFFGPDEVVFFENYQMLAAELATLLEQPQKIEEIAAKGQQRVLTGGFDYASVLSGILRRVSLIK